MPRRRGRNCSIRISPVSNRLASGVLPDDVPVWAVDANASFARPGPRLVDGVEALAGILHPEAFADRPASPIGRRVRDDG
jgi:iron complex transport system substrate-binding protein